MSILPILPKGYFMFKKKKRPILAIAVGALAVFGAYSMVCSLKNCCLEKMQMISGMFKKSAPTAPVCDEECDC